MPVQFSMTDETIFQDDLKAAEKLFAGYSTEENDLDLLQELVPPEVESRLLRLYSQFVHPWYPVLSLRDLQTPLDRECRLSAPIGIRSAVYALAAPFTFLDDELSVMKAYWTVPTDDLWAIAHRSFQRASRLAHLSLLQLCLLLLQTPPQNFAVADPPSFWSLSCSALAIAESLGLNMDPSSWKLPHREIMLRRRLWWLTYMGHTWRALVCGRPSHINDSNWDVLDLTEDDFEGIEHPDDDVRHAIVRQVSICVANCKLSMIAADVLKEFYTLRANREAVSLNSLLARAQPLRARIQCWRQTHPLLLKPVCDLSEDEFADSVSLRLSHLTLEILVFRALLRPLHPGATSATDASQEPISTIFENCYMCAKVTSEVVASLQSRHFTSFWYPGYFADVRYQLCYVSTFILLNFAQSTTEESAVRNKALLSKWRDTLRIQARSWPLARLAAVRVDAIFWKGIQPLIDGAGPESPAVRLLREEGIRKRLVKERMNE
ncbi:GAL4 [Geosmithia morbida]|uniref:GAL4 n=1 Tax=Geosmithia morbida TaxID=1094350 RepID=A0A9P5D7T2_9HYPO|nr:GAL4 [Geosmithia morbida]KAF4124834.1 GAL4 [Geosmithia morbida]